MRSQSYSKYKMIEPENGEKKARAQVTRGFANPTFIIWLLVVIAIAAAIGISLSQPERLGWLFMVKEVQTGELGEVAVVLAPLLALALAIERLIETIFDLFEQSILPFHRATLIVALGERVAEQQHHVPGI